MALGFRSVLHAVGLDLAQELYLGNGFEVVRATYQTPFGSSDSTLLYLDSSMTWTSLAQAQDLVATHGVRNVLVAKSAPVANDLRRVGVELRLEQPARTLHQLLESALQRSPTASLTSDVFLDPSIYVGHDELPIDVDTRQRALETLHKWITAPPTASEPRLGVLIAPGGIGKTTVSEALVAGLRADRRVPLFVTASRWARLSGLSELSLWDIWQSALPAEGLNFADELVFETYVRAGIVVPVLDGFDELCSQRSDHFKPSEVIAALESVLEGEDGKVLLTTRDAFWNEYVSEDLRRKLWIARLYPFNKQQVMKYFEQSFLPKNKRGYQKATEILTLLQKSIPVADGPSYRKSVLGVPAVINLVREAARETEGEPLVPIPRTGVDAVQWVLEYVCERERTRRLNHAPVESQMRFFGEVAIDLGESFSRDSLQIWQSTYLPELDAYPSEIDALGSHFLLQCIGDQFCFRFALVPEHLSARRLCEYARQPDAKTLGGGSVAGLLARHASGNDTFIDKVVALLPAEPTSARSAMSVLLRIVSDKQGAVFDQARSALVHIALRLAERAVGSGPRADRTGEFAKLLGLTGQVLRNSFIVGPITGLDLVEWTIEKCVFRNSGFVRCRFGPRTRFNSCRFEGSFDLQGAEGISGILVAPDCSLSSEARVVFQRMLSRDNAPPITEEQIRDCMGDVLRLFGEPGQFHPIAASSKRRGKLGASAIAASVWDAMVKSKVIEVRDMGRGSDDFLVSVAKEAIPAVLQFLKNGLAAAQMERALVELRQKFLR